jgi:hypothetical protein
VPTRPLGFVCIVCDDGCFFGFGWIIFSQSVLISQNLSLYEHNLNDFKSGIDKGIQSSCMNLLNHYCDSSIRPEEIRNVLRVELRCDSPAVAYAHMMLDRACGMNPLKSFITTIESPAALNSIEFDDSNFAYDHSMLDRP